MVTRLNVSNQFTLVNAPAGSGKTTAISKDVLKLSKESPKRILCITYTNRAAEELKNQITNNNVDISTIHSFVTKFMSPFFQFKEVIKFFSEHYINEIENSISKLTEEKKEKYRNKFNLEEDVEFNVELVQRNLEKIEYNEMQFSSWLYGGLSHDELLDFSRAVLQKFPKIKRVLSQKYAYIFIDEYQDTHSNVLHMFYDSVLDTETKLILLGDKMQQIYSDRVDDFLGIISSEFYEDFSLSENWRSQTYIVDVLNNIYFDKEYEQNPRKPKGEKPKFYIVEGFDNNYQENTLQLVLLNSAMYGSIGALNLFNAYKLKYGFLSKHSPKDILSDMSLDNPDDLITILVFITEICELYDKQFYGRLVQNVKNFKHSNKETWKITSHVDKLVIKRNIESLKNKLSEQEATLNEILNFLRTNNLIEKQYIDTILENIKNVDEISSGFEEKILAVKYTEFNNCFIGMKNPKFSTQHAVKGEGHDNVILNLEDSVNPNVKMYLFLSLFANDVFDYLVFERININCKTARREFETRHNLKLSKLTSRLFSDLKDEVNELVKKFDDIFNSNKLLYDFLFKEKIEEFYLKENLTKFKEVIKLINLVEGVIQAYKLFYVGCSRAKENLSVCVLKDEVKEFEPQLLSKFNDIGFECIPIQTPITLEK